MEIRAMQKKKPLCTHDKKKKIRDARTHTYKYTDYYNASNMYQRRIIALYCVWYSNPLNGHI